MSNHVLKRFPSFARFVFVMLSIQSLYVPASIGQEAVTVVPAPADVKKAPWADSRRILESGRELLQHPVVDKDGKVTRKSYVEEKAERDRQEDAILAVTEATKLQDDERGRTLSDETRRRAAVKAAGETVNEAWFKERKLDELFAKLAEAKKFVSDKMAGLLLDQRKEGKVKPTELMDEKQYSSLAETNDLLVDLLGGEKSAYAERGKVVEGLLNSCPTPEAARDVVIRLETLEVELVKTSAEEKRWNNAATKELLRIEKLLGDRLPQRPFTVEQLIAALETKKKEILRKTYGAQEDLDFIRDAQERLISYEDYSRWHNDAKKILAQFKPTVAAELDALTKALAKCEAIEADSAKVGEIDFVKTQQAVVSDDVRKGLRNARDAFAELDRSHRAAREALEPKKVEEAGAAK